MEQLQSHILLTASSYMGKYFPISSYTVLGSPSSYMTLQLLHSKFPYIWGKFSFLFYQCTLQLSWQIYILKITVLYYILKNMRSNKIINKSNPNCNFNGRTVQYKCKVQEKHKAMNPNFSFWLRNCM